jgi:hypothetical protein
MQETGFSIWMGALCSTQATAVSLLGISVRSVRRYQQGVRRVPRAVAMLMTVKAIAFFNPGVAVDFFDDIVEWPDLPDEARAVLDRIRGTEQTAGARNSDTGTGSPQIADIRTAGPQNSDNGTAGPHNPDIRTNGPLKSWFSWWGATADPTR